MDVFVCMCTLMCLFVYIDMLVCMFMYMLVCLHECTCLCKHMDVLVYVCVHGCACVWRSEVNFGYCSSGAGYHNFLRQGLSLTWNFLIGARLASEQAPGIHLSLLI